MNDAKPPILKRSLSLQGMRAIAVMAVIAYHFGIPGTFGGFVGVDIFFVLSGFFITRLLWRDVVEHGRVRLARFWANRAKRLLPNGLLTILAIIVASALLLPAYRQPDIAAAARDAALFIANFHFEQRAVDYFHLDDPPSPLLHYWSLAIEEQFYLVLPLLLGALAVITRVRRLQAAIVLLALIAFGSLVASLIAIEKSQPAAFYFPWNRAWQLACGGLVGLLFEQRARLPALVREVGALVGLVVIGVSIVSFSDDMLYPGLWALAPTLGTVAILIGLDAGGQKDFASRLLGARPLVWIGDISYSLYLWHWPVAILGASLWPHTGAAFIFGGLALTVSLACGAYYFIERPIHQMRLSPVNPTLPLTVAAGSIVCIVAATLGLASLAPTANARATSQIASAAADDDPNIKKCHLILKEIVPKPCVFGKIDGPRVVLFGDSHAAQWFAPLQKAALEAGWRVEVRTKTSCPTADVSIWYPGTKTKYIECDQWRETRLDDLISNPPALVIVGNYSGYYGWIFDEDRSAVADRRRSEQIWRDGMARTAKKLTDAGLRVVEIVDTPHMYAGYKDCLSSDTYSECARPRGEALSGMRTDKFQSPLYSYLDVNDLLCSAEECPAATDGKIVYRDTHHLTSSYALSLYRSFLPILAIQR